MPRNKAVPIDPPRPINWMCRDLSLSRHQQSCSAGESP
jgi:hypothetical protein